MSVIEIGCCGAYCKTCKAYAAGSCKGCKTGYEDGSRDISKAKCAMKVCCIGRGLSSCAYCKDFESCETVGSFYSKNGYKYGKYKQSALFIKKNGCEEFIKTAESWTNAYGKLK